MVILDAIAAVLALCFLAVCILLRRSVREPRVLRLDATGYSFEVPQPQDRLLHVALPVLFLLIFVDRAVQYLVDDHLGELRSLEQVVLLLSGLAAVVVLIQFGFLTFEWTRRPLAITEEGVVDRNRLVPWDAVLTDPKLAARRLPIALPLTPSAQANSDLGADPVFVGAAIGYYLRHPESREWIGDDEELDHLYEEVQKTYST